MRDFCAACCFPRLLVRRAVSNRSTKAASFPVLRSSGEGLRDAKAGYSAHGVGNCFAGVRGTACHGGAVGTDAGRCAWQAGCESGESANWPGTDRTAERREAFALGG